MEAKSLVGSDVTLKKLIKQVGNLVRVETFLCSFEEGERQKTEGSLDGITYSESIEEILAIMEEYVKVLNSIKITESEQYKRLQAIIFELLNGIEGLLDVLNTLQGIKYLDKNEQISAFDEMVNKFRELNLPIGKAEDQLRARNQKSADFISKLPFRDKKKQEYAQNVEKLDALNQRLNIALAVLGATFILAFAVTFVLAGLVTAPYCFIPLGITILSGFTFTAIALYKKPKIEEEMNANENFQNAPLGFGAYLNTEFKSGIIPTVKQSYNFFKQENTSSVPLISTEPSIPYIERFLRCSVPPKR